MEAFSFKQKSLDDFKTEIELLCLEVELLDEKTKGAVIKHLEETVDVLKLGNSGNPSEPPNKRIKIEMEEEESAEVLIETNLFSTNVPDKKSYSGEEKESSLANVTSADSADEKELFVEDIVKQLYDGKVPSCKGCGKRFASLGALYTHDKSVHLGDVVSNVPKKSFGPTAAVSKDSNGRYPCNLCEESYTDKSNLSRHKRKKHTVNNEGKNLLNVQNEATSNSQGELCGKDLLNVDVRTLTFNKDDESMEHQNSIQNVPSSEENNDIEEVSIIKRKEDKIESSVSSANSVRYSCNLCDQSYTRKSNLSRHKSRTHSIINENKLLKVGDGSPSNFNQEEDVSSENTTVKSSNSESVSKTNSAFKDALDESLKSLLDNRDETVDAASNTSEDKAIYAKKPMNPTPSLEPLQASDSTSSNGKLRHCSYCKLDMAKNNYTRHVEGLLHKELAIQCILGQTVSHKGEYQCRYCKRKSPALKNFIEHLRIHKNSIEELFNNTFRPLEKVENEIPKLNDIQEPSMSMKLVEAISGSKEPIEMAQCDKCNKYFANKQNLDNHMKTHDQSESMLLGSSIPDLIVDAKRQIGY